MPFFRVFLKKVTSDEERLRGGEAAPAGGEKLFWGIGILWFWALRRPSVLKSIFAPLLNLYISLISLIINYICLFTFSSHELTRLVL